MTSEAETGAAKLKIVPMLRLAAIKVAETMDVRINILNVRCFQKVNK
jgi:hypothetical protein